MNETPSRAGFVAVVGRPNAGKSSLLNFLVGERLAMVSHKAQATRKRMNIIVMHKNAQIVFVDTPGIHEQEKLLNRFMLEEALKAIGDADLILFVAPVTDSTMEYERFLERTEGGRKHLLILAKTDRISNAGILAKIGEYRKFQDRFLALVPFSVKKGASPDILLDEIARHLPEHPWLYDPEIMTTETIREIYREMIREAVFEKLSEEIPYESDVVIDRIEEKRGIDKVYATIVTEKETQKRMMIGSRGETIRRIGSRARRMLEHFSGKKIFLDLHVIVRKGWSKNRKELEKIGYFF
jgi:GTP-binding protein Era